MSEWLERNRGYIVVLLLSLLLNGMLVLYLHRPPPTSIQVILPTETPTLAHLRVFVSGAVAKPDVYELTLGSLVKDAIQAAGGSTTEADLTQINLARELKDGEQILVPSRTVSPEGTSSPTATNERINLNVASPSELESLPGIGPTLAKRIIAFRERNGPFRSIEDLQRVEGIGPATFERIKDRIATN